MSEPIKHECGIALVRLLKPLEYYLAKYGNSFYGLSKLHLLMEKQHNRGQDGAGIANIKFDMPVGKKFINRIRSAEPNAIDSIFKQAFEKLRDIQDRYPQRLKDMDWLKENVDFTGELFLGHLRYGTFGFYGIENIHPVVRENNWITRNLILAGNFNLTNVSELFQKLIDYGQNPVETSDTVTILEKIGHYLDEENQAMYHQYKDDGVPKKEISRLIASELDLQKILSQGAKSWDGGYAIAGMLGHGDAFVMRDPSGIRPLFYYQDDEVVVAASERPAIQTTFNVSIEHIKELKPGHALIIKRNGQTGEYKFREPLEKKACSFERIYFSRGSDQDIYQERKDLGKYLTPSILDAIGNDIENTVFSYIPNTAVVAYYGLIQELNVFCNKIAQERILALGSDLTPAALEKILSLRPRIEKVAIKDAALRTFITADLQRNELVGHIYDITYGSIRKGIDNLVILDDSIVRGTTLKKSIIRILDRLEPKKIVIASSAPQIRYPDCYGIDMAKLGDFVAFQSAIALLKETNQGNVINEVYKKCKEHESLPVEKVVNHVKEIYTPFLNEQLSDKITQLLTPKGLKSDIQIVYQKIDDLHLACPKHLGDWYFTGNYPTPGGNKVVNRSFINFIEGKSERAY